MEETINIDYCENTEEVLASEILWDIGLRIIAKRDRHSLGYYTSIVEKLKKKEEINEQEYSDIVDFLSSDEFLSEAKKFYSKSKININLDVIFDDSHSVNTDSLSHLSFDNIVSSIENHVAESLIKNLANTGEIGEIYPIGRQRYICADVDSNKMIYKILYEIKTSEGMMFAVETNEKKQGIVSENGDVIIPIGEYILIDYVPDDIYECFLLIKEHKESEENEVLHGIANMDGKEVYGGCKWDQVVKIVEAENGEKYGLVKKEKKEGLVMEDGTEIYGGCSKWIELCRSLEAPSGELFWVVKNLSGKVGIVTKEGQEIHGGCKWSTISSIIEDEDMNSYAEVSLDGKRGLVTEEGEEVYGGIQWEGVKSYVISPDGRERYWEMIQRRDGSRFIGNKTCLVGWGGNNVYGEKRTKIKEFVIAPNGQIYLWVYSHADAYHLEGLVKKDGTPAFGGCMRHIKEIIFYQDKLGTLYLEIPNSDKKAIYIDVNGDEKGFFTKVEKIENWKFAK